MPVYLCQPGTGYTEPWRHGIHVYAAPFPIDKNPPGMGGGRDFIVSNSGGGNDLVVANATSGNPSESTPAPASSFSGHPIRRVRHAEIVIVDDVCIAYDRYWLRLRWPGSKGGFAGYIAMGLVSESPSRPKEITLPGGTNTSENIPVSTSSLEERGGTEDADMDDPIREEEPQETGSMPPSEPFESDIEVTCLRTGLSFQSSTVLKLLAMYDDGVAPSVALAPFPTEPVFCRICREGLHDDDADEQPGPAAEDGDEGNRDPSTRSMDDDDPTDDPVDSDPTNITSTATKGPVQPHPAYNANPHALENPLLAPCECSGSMAFVHYLCVEQWRCRSRHPEAVHGLNCETCGTAYALPPPSARPAHVPQIDQEDWLDAMPPHVMQALRQPHIWWQIGAAIVRRRWLRPIAPVLMSPVVALYCRARRLLKKRGVARRRWACSLCRRRARWKCVRCLRSYYCSRQCQNVSWHIVHKHVCYKPARFWWSVIVYGAATLALFPGILRDPLMYDLGLCLIPVSFIIMGILGGGLATLLKRAVGVDLRGRLMELAVVLWTLWLTWVSWGLVRGFFGDSSACHGSLGSYSVSADELGSSLMLNGMRNTVLKPIRSYYLMWDGLALKTGPWLQSAMCTGDGTLGCFEHLPHANEDFFLKETNGERCAGDLLTVIWLYIAAGFAYVGSAYWKRIERERRRHGRGRPVRADARPHQD